MKPVEIRPWRPSPFVAGRTYRVRIDFKSLFDTFQSGEVVKYEGDAYSRYDCITGYFFSQPNVPNGRRWDIHDDEDLETWRKLFEEVQSNET
jgi:hypothetical protein